VNTRSFLYRSMSKILGKISNLNKYELIVSSLLVLKSKEFRKSFFLLYKELLIIKKSQNLKFPELLWISNYII
jgi:hypothetical protein